MPLPNIGARGRRQREIAAAAWFVVGAIATSLLNAWHAPPPWYAILVVPFTLAALGYFQARAATCVVLATLGQRDQELAGTGPRRLNEAERRVVRRQALGVAVQSIAVGVIATAVLWWLFARGRG